MSIKATVEKLEENNVKLSVEVPVDEVILAIDKAFTNLAKKVNVPGFRKGKVPRSVLEVRIGIEPAIEETLNEMVPQWYLKAVELTGIKPIDKPQVDFGEEYDKDKMQKEPLKFEATVEVKPEVKLGKYLELEIERESNKVTESEAEQNLNLLRERFATLEVVEKRKVKSGDFALIDFKGYLNDDIVSQGSDFLLEVGANSLMDDFDNNIVGMKKGEARKFDLTFPEDYQRLDLAGQTVTYKVDVKEIKKKVLPEINDDFAKEVSDFDTMEEFKKEIKKDLSEVKKNQINNIFRGNVLKAVSEASEVKIPEILVNVRTEELFREFIQSLSARGVTLEQLLESSQKSREDLINSFRAEAEVQVKNELVLDTIVEKEKLELSEEEFMEQLKEGAERFSTTAVDLRKQIHDRGTEDMFKESVLREKALNFITEKAIPVAKKVTEKGEGKKAKVGKTKAKKKEG